jgi:phosphoribosylglycinamide formyltransferase 1
MPIRVVVAASTGGAVLGRLLEVPGFRSRIVSVVADRACGAIAKAQAAGVPSTVGPCPDGATFSAALLDHLDAVEADYLVLFYTRLLSGPLLDRYAGRIVNLHPSLLPAFPGLHPFDDALAAGTRFVGTTIHFVDASTDGGPVIAQTCTPADPTVDRAVLRHELFVHQCRSLLQVVEWLEAGRVRIDGSTVVVEGASYADPHYSPSLEHADACSLNIPMPESLR